MILFNAILLNQPKRYILVFNILMYTILFFLVYLKFCSKMSSTLIHYIKQHNHFLKLSFDCFITCDVFNVTCCIDMDSFSDTSKAVILVAISIVDVFKIKHLQIGFRNILDPAFVVSNTKVCLTAVFLFRDLPDLFFRYNVTFYSIKKCQVHFITLFQYFLNTEYLFFSFFQRICSNIV